MLGLGLVAAGVRATPDALAQTKIRFDGPTCGMQGTQQVGEITAFAATSDAKQVVADICATVALPPNFTVVAARDPKVNAFAQVKGGQRYVVYDESFMRSISDRSARNWSGFAVMAHEVGHHLCGHTLDGLGSRPPKELEADHFAGFVVGTLGGTLDQALKLFQGMSDKGSATHPPRRERLAAVQAGWQKASARKKKDSERHNVITHNKQPDGSYARVIAEFVNQGGVWTEHQHGKAFARFAERARDRSAVYLFDKSRTMWLKLEVPDARFAEAFWSPGGESVIPTKWSPLDPVRWR